MNEIWKQALTEQFGGSLAMLENTMRNCPDGLWRGRMWDDPAMPPEFSSVWYTAYHALFWLDFYLSGADADFTPPPPFTLSELDPAGKLPPRMYIREELLTYLEHCRKKGLAAIVALSDENAARVCRFNWGEISFLGLLIDTIRHTQEHAAQLAMYLGQQAGINSRWVTKE